MNHNEEGELIYIHRSYCVDADTQHLIVCADKNLSPMAIRELTNNDLCHCEPKDPKAWTIQPTLAKFGEITRINPHRCRNKQRRHWVLHYQSPSLPRAEGK